MTTVDLGCDAAVQITASHHPFNRNGLKFFTRDGGLDAPDIEAILQHAQDGDIPAAADGGSAEDIDYMANAGMTSILFGVESGSKRMQKIINKNLDFSKGREIIKYAVSKGIKAKVSFMYGFPEETEDDFEDTLRLILEFQRLGAYIVIWRCGILNGTAMYDKFKDDLFLSDKNWKNYSFFGFRENRAMIKSHPTIFPHFYDHPNPLRKKTEFFDLFFYLWKDFSRVDFDRVADKFMLSAKRLVDMYDIFVSANMSMLSTHTPRSLDRFWNFSEDECRTLVDNFINCVDISNI
jgi:radical SAM superfamily enzyme YgiQ (UPF0313 family)